MVSLGTDFIRCSFKMFPEFAGIIYMFLLSGIVHHESIPTGKTMNKEKHIAVLRRLSNAVRRKLPEK